VLSIYNFFDIRKRSERRLQVSLQTVTLSSYEGILTEPVFRVAVTNLGQRNVTVTNLGLELPEGRTLATLHNGYRGLDDTVTPKTLADGEIAYRHLSYEDVAGAIQTSDLPLTVKLKPFAVDSAENRHYGDEIDFNSKEWLL